MAFIKELETMGDYGMLGRGAACWIMVYHGEVPPGFCHCLHCVCYCKIILTQ